MGGMELVVDGIVEPGVGVVVVHVLQEGVSDAGIAGMVEPGVGVPHSVTVVTTVEVAIEVQPAQKLAAQTEDKQFPSGIAVPKQDDWIAVVLCPEVGVGVVPGDDAADVEDCATGVVVPEPPPDVMWLPSCKLEIEVDGAAGQEDALAHGLITCPISSLSQS